MKFLKKYLLDILVVIAFAIISFVYFMPADMDGRILFRHDAAAGKGLGHEKELFQQQTGETTRWTNSVFGGMPTYQMSPSYDSNQVLSQIVKAYHLWLPDYVWYVFVYLLGFYIMLRAFNFRQSLAALGSIIWAFSSYFFYHYRCRTYLEGMGAGLSAADDCGRGACLSGQVSQGTAPYCHLLGFRGAG